MKTKTIDKSLNPIWNESFTFDNVDVRAPLEVKVWDKDTVSGHNFPLGAREYSLSCTDDLMGTLVLDTSQQSPLEPGYDFAADKWFPINPKYPKAELRLRFVFQVPMNAWLDFS